MLEKFRKFAPALMVPAAWMVTALALNTEIISNKGFQIAHIVMAVLMTVFLLTGWKEMSSGVLKIWRTVIAIGLLITVSGAVGLTFEGLKVLQIFSLYGWMVMPGIALYYTGKENGSFEKVYRSAGLVTIAGFLIFSMANFVSASKVWFLGLLLVALGQSLGIFTAVYHNAGLSNN